MSVAVELPELGESVVEGTVSRWLVKEGDRVEQDQPLVEVTTDKVDAEIPSPAAGVVEKILVPEGETVSVGTELARIEPGAEAGARPEARGEAEARTRSAPAGREERAEREEAPREREEAPPERREPARAAEPERAPEPARGAEPAAERPAEPRATPVARRMAQRAGVDLGSLEGTGPSGQITKEDVERATERPTAPATSPPPARTERAPGRERPAGPAAPAAPAGPAAARGRRPAFLDYQLQPGDRVIPMSPLRRLVAEHMVLSKQVSPHVGTVAEVDMGGVVRVRDAHKRSFRESRGFALTYLPFVVHATVRALRDFPRLNASVVDDSIVEKRDVHVGIAVETEKGLVVPVVRNADRLSLTGIAEAVEDLAERARTKKLSPDELKGGTFTVSNPGRQGNLYGFAIINQPQVGILRMGEIVKRPVVRSADGEDAIAIRPMMFLALSYDHRAVDGAPANGFLYRVRELLEEAEFDL